MAVSKVPGHELALRMERFTRQMDAAYGDWELCAIIGGVNMFYLTGTICDGILLIRRDEGAALWVRRSFERAMLESEFGDIRRMSGFRDVKEGAGPLPDALYLDMAHATLEWYSLLGKYMSFGKVLPADGAMLKARAVKSEYELERMRLAGSSLDRLLREDFPALLRGGMSEAELGADLLALFLKNGHHGVGRFMMRNATELLGQIAFGDSSLYPCMFNGASGIAGLCPAVPAMGSNDRLLAEGDLIFVDVVFGVDGYNVDKTLVFSYKRGQPEYIEIAHRHCIDLQLRAASLLKSGAKPSAIFDEISGAVMPEHKHRFMGAPGRAVPFIGHSVGLYVDETPVIAKGFDDPLESGMTIAIEPKMGFDGVGMVGGENTYLVTPGGGVSLTGEAREILIV